VQKFSPEIETEEDVGITDRIQRRIREHESLRPLIRKMVGKEAIQGVTIDIEGEEAAIPKLHSQVGLL